MKAALVQYSPVWEKPEENIKRIESLLNNKLTDEEILIFPEMTLTGFTMESRRFGEELDGIGTKYFINLAAKIKKHIFAGIIEKDNNNYFNSFVHFDNNGIIAARYQKIHPFSFAKEEKYYAAGNKPLLTKVNKVLYGLSICYDLRFPELYRLYTKDRVQVLVDIANWPITRIEHWKHLLKARAIENQCFMIGVNRVGNDPFNEYNGCSSAFDPMGNELIMVADKEELIKIDMDIELVEETRTSLPFLRDIKLI